MKLLVSSIVAASLFVGTLWQVGWIEFNNPEYYDFSQQNLNTVNPLSKLCYVTEVYDGDTITVDIDLLEGEFVLKDQSIRLFGIAAPEVRGEEREQGLIIRDLLRERILHKLILVETHGRGKFGRILGVIYLEGENINDWLLEHELVDEYLE